MSECSLREQKMQCERIQRQRQYREIREQVRLNRIYSNSYRHKFIFHRHMEFPRLEKRSKKRSVDKTINKHITFSSLVHRMHTRNRHVDLWIGSSFFISLLFTALAVMRNQLAL